MPFYVYILQSLKDNSFYIGQCDDLDKRMSKHFDGMSRYTASKRPLRLRYFEIFSTRSDAIKRERQIKSYKNRKYIQSLIYNRIVLLWVVEGVPTCREKVCIRETVNITGCFSIRNIQTRYISRICIFGLWKYQKNNKGLYFCNS